MAEKLLHEPLPPPWTYGVSKDGRVFFINDESQTTSWLHPFLGEPISTGNRPRQDLPRGWEETVTPEGAPYFVNHNERKTTFNHPSTGQPELTDDLHYLVERSPKKDQLSVSSFSTNTDMEKPNFVKKTVPKKAAPAVKRRDKSNVTVRGWLYKQDSSGLKTWRKRWCVLDSLDSGNSGAPSSVPSSDMHPRSQSHTLPSKAHYQRSPAVRYPTMPWNASYQTPESQQIDLPPNDRSHSVKYGTLPSQSSYPVQEPRQEPIRSAEKYHTMPLRPSQQQQQQQQQQQYYSPESLSPSSPREMQRQESLRKLHDWVKTREGSSSDALRTSTQSLPVQKTTTVNDYARRDTTTQYKSTPPQNTNTTPHRPPLPNDYSRKHKEDERLRNEEQFRNLQKKKEMEPLVFRFPETNTYQQPGKSPEQRSFLQSPVGVGTEQRTVIQSPYTFNIFSDKRPAPQQQHRQQNGHYRSPNKAPSGYYSESDATDRSHPNYSAERQVYPSHQQSERAVDSRHLYTHQEESPHALSPNRSQYSPRGTQEHTYRSQSSRSLEDIERKSRNLTDVMDLETGYHQQPQQYRNQAEDLVDKVMRRMDTKPPPGSGGGGGRMKKLSKKPPELMTMNGHRLRLSISAGDLMGKTHEELVLLLIQLRRNYAGMEKSKDILKQQIELEKDILAHPHGPTGNSQSYRKQYSDDFRRTQQELFEHQRKYEEMKKENDEIEKRLDVSRPLINLVDNLVKMGSLYGGENAMVVQELYKYQYQLRGDQYTPPKRLIEFSRKLQEDKLVHDHEAELKKLETKDDRDLEEKLQRLYDLDRKLQDCSTYVSGLREDMDKIEKGLERINKHLDQYRDNPTEYHEIEKQRIVLEKELVKVRAMLADGSKESMRAKIKLEKELNQAQVIIDDLSRQKNALQAEMEQVRELAVEESKMKDLSEKTHVINDSHISGPYMVTDLDSLSTKDISQMKTPPKAAAPQRSDSFKKVQKMKKQVQQLAQPPPATQRSYSATPPKDQTYTTTQLVSSAPSRSKTKPIQVISPMQQPNRPPPPKYYQTGSDSPADATQYTPKSSASHPRTVSASDKSKHTMREVKRESERRSREKEMKKVNGDELRQRSSSADRTYTSPARKSRTLPSRRYMGVQRSPDGRSNSLGGRYDAYPRLTDQLRTTGRPSSANSDSERTTTTVTTRRQRTLSAGEDPIMHRSRVEAPLQSAPPPIPNEYRRQGGLRSTDGVNPRIRSKSAIERAAVRAKRSQTLPSGLNADSRYIVSDVDSSQACGDNSI
uniref:Uncharacterized protein LOC100371867 n=1 Tax=Saccoglossus kowalevskii TaxID=10224 RepID=A0ABM0M755_SACKO|nr:PREDICTED: uncharacterized protein LOC100371867 [Saccoglossus kowalevskii]